MKTTFNKLVPFLSLILILSLSTIQNSQAQQKCGQSNGGECGGSPFKDCCEKATQECRSIYTDELITEDSNEFGECKEKKEKEKEKEGSK